MFVKHLYETGAASVTTLAPKLSENGWPKCLLSGFDSLLTPQSEEQNGW